MYLQYLHGEWLVGKLGTSDWFSASVPGSIHVDLMEAGVIPNPFSEANEEKTAWVAETDWVYRRTFTADHNLLDKERIFLEFDGLDTLATVTLNGEEIASTDNMFRRYSFDVTGKVLSGVNTLEIKFASPVKYVRSMIDESSTVVSPSDSIPGSPYLRKAAYQWGWDWAPKLPTCGIWRDIRIVGYSTAKIGSMYAEQHHKDGAVSVTLHAEIERFTDDPVNFCIWATAPDGYQENRVIEIPAGATKADLNFDVPNPQLWWPNGYGEQPLYTVRVDLQPVGECHEECGKHGSPHIFDTRKRRVGLRTIELRQEEDQFGKSFYFVVNGTRIISKGANWVPADQFPARVTKEQYRSLISSVAASNMNMLRVWGGGIYEDDDFYSLCDEYGILVWQDFMFSCGHYPVNQEMLDNIAAEATDNVRRLRHHACLALWCGNNEMEWAINEWWPERKEERKAEYQKIFGELLPKICAKESPLTPYWPSSPSSGEPFVNPNSEDAGDGHYWDVWHGKKPFTAYREHDYRFMSEFGFESFPSMYTIRTFASPEQWNMVSYVMEKHQKNPAGNGLILDYLVKNYRMPNGFAMMCYVSQILQAEAMRHGVEHWRRSRNDNRCMGALYWQLNDCWPAISWSSIEYTGRWKALQYFAKRFYAPVLLSIVQTGKTVKLHVTNDTTEEFTGQVRWTLERTNGIKIVDGQIDVIAPAELDSVVGDLDFSESLDEDDLRDAVLVYGLWIGGKRLSMEMAAFVPCKHLELLDSCITHYVEEMDGRIEINLAAHNAARYVALEVPGYDIRFSNNFFDLPAGRLLSVSVEDPKGLTADEIEEKLRVVSLADSY